MHEIHVTTPGLGVAVSVDPVSSGSIVGSFKGLNATTLTCNITDLGTQINTHWSLKNFREIPGVLRNVSTLAPDILISGDPVPSDNSSTYQNHLTILNWTLAIDRVTVYCGTEQDTQLANFILRLYRK